MDIVALLHGAIMNGMAGDQTLVADIVWVRRNEVDAGSGVYPNGQCRVRINGMRERKILACKALDVPRGTVGAPSHVEPALRRTDSVNIGLIVVRSGASDQSALRAGPASMN